MINRSSCPFPTNPDIPYIWKGFPSRTRCSGRKRRPSELWRPICPRNGTGPTSGGPCGSRCAAGVFPAETARRCAALRGTSGTQHFHSSSLVIPILAPSFPAELTIRSYRIHVNFFFVFDLVSIFMDIFFIYTLYYFAINVN